VMLVFGGGLKLPIRERFFADIGYRFAPILSTSDVENDVTIKTQRVTFGFGARF
jgi:hypothetical protein